MFSKIVALIVVLAVTTAGTGLAIAYHNGLFSSNNNPQTPLPVNLPPSNNSSSPQSNNTTSTTNNNIQSNVIVSQVQAYFTISDSQGDNVNFSEQFPGFKMMAGNSTQVNITIMNNNFFNMTISRMIINSGGFDLENVNPLFPASVSSYSYRNFTLQIFAQNGMKHFNGSIQIDILGYRTTDVSVSNIYMEELVNNSLNNSTFIQMLQFGGFSSISGFTKEYNFTVYNNNTYAINITQISISTKGFSLYSIVPNLPIVIMPNETRTLTMGINISNEMAGYHSNMTIRTNSTSTTKVTITSIKPYLENDNFYEVPSIFGTVKSNGEAGDNFTVQIALMEYYGDCAEISGFTSSTPGFTVISAYPFGGTLPYYISNEETWFIVNIHVSKYMAGYSGQISIGIDDNQC